MARLTLVTTIRLLDLAVAAINAHFNKTNPRRRLVLGPSTIFSAKFPLLLGATVGLMSCLVTLCTVAIAYGHLRSTPDTSRRLALHHCGALPCFRGITPGLTSWPGATATAALVGNTQLFQHQIFFQLGSDGGAALYPSVDGLTVGMIYFAVPTDIPLTVGDIVNEYGPPCVLPVNPDDQILTLYYPRLTVITQISHRRLTVGTPAKYIDFSDPADLSQIAEDPCGEVPIKHILPQGITRPWRGFASVSQYLAEEITQ